MSHIQDLQLFDSLSEDFDSPIGILEGYLSGEGDPKLLQHHYDLRGFYNDEINVPNTIWDMKYWNVNHFDTVTMHALGSHRVLTGREFRPRTLAEINQYTMSELNELTMQQLDFLIISIGNEEWNEDSSSIIVKKDPEWRYMNTLILHIPAGNTVEANSFYTDDILTGLNEAGIIYYIEGLLKMPAQADPSHVDLDDSFIDFSSSETFQPSVTDSLRLSDSLTSLTGGNSFFRFNRDSIINADLTNIKAVRFRIKAEGPDNITVKVQNLRIVHSGVQFNQGVEIDGKRQRLGRSIQRDGSEPLDNFFDFFVFPQTRPVNFVEYVRFNSGHHPSAPDKNELAISGRRTKDGSSFITCTLTSNADEARISITHSVAGEVNSPIFQTPSATNVLPQERGLLFVVHFEDERVRADIYEEHGTFIGNLLLTTGWQEVPIVRRGHVGFFHKPYMHDFYLSSLRNGGAEFAHVEGSTFHTRSPILGGVLYTKNSPSIDILDGHQLLPHGDVTITSSPAFGNPPPATKIERSGTEWLGGLQSDTSIPLDLVDVRHIYARGSIYPVEQVRGEYRIAIVDAHGSVAFLGYIQNLIQNQWNNFEIPIHSTLIPSNYFFQIHQTGFYNDTFYIDNISLDHESVIWELSVDGGNLWLPFLSSINNPYKALHMPMAGNQIRIKATAVSDRAWIGQGYEFKPIYRLPGHR